MKFFYKFVITVLTIIALFRWFYNIWTEQFLGIELFDMKLGMTLNNFYIRISILSLIISTIVIIAIASFSAYVYNLTRNKQPPVGDKGDIGLRGNSGKPGSCQGGCDNKLCYRKIMQTITETYNIWKKAKGLPVLTHGQQISNIFLKKKASQMCNSKNYKKLLSTDGAGKIDKYVNSIWKKWIFIILKYKKGSDFLDSENLTDNDFDNMITSEDKEYANIHNMLKDGTPSRGTESPFDIIKKYDMWYWGNNPLSRPIVVNDCDPYKKKESSETVEPEPVLKMLETNDYHNPLWTNKNARQRTYNKGIVEMVCQWYRQCIQWNVHDWVRGGRRCLRAANKCNPIPKCKWKPQMELKDKGIGRISVYRPKSYIDNNENIKYKEYHPMGDIVLSGDYKDHRKSSHTKCLPKKPKGSNSCDKHNYVTGDPHQKTVLVTGDVKPPTGYKQMYGSKRERGINSKSVGYSFWRPIPPKGYRCLGDIIDTSYHNKEPSVDLIRCVPSKCTRKVNNSSKIWDTSVSAEDKCTSHSQCDCFKENIGKGIISDTDFLSQYGNVKMHTNPETYHLFRTRNPKYQDDDGHFYEIIPPGQKGDSGEDSCLNTPKIKTDPSIKYKKWNVPKKNDLKYSILKIYEK